MASKASLSTASPSTASASEASLSEASPSTASASEASASKAVPARVTAVHKERYQLICPHGQTFGRLKTAAYFAGGELFPTTGDFVLVDNYGMGDCRILRTLPRKSFFSRLDPSSSGHAEQAVASNFDYVFILQSLNYDFNLRRMERYLTLAWQSGAIPVIVLTKADLVSSYDEQVADIQSIAIGTDVVVISAQSRFGLDSLEQYLQPKQTIVFLGSSGVGKSSLVNALMGSERMAVSAIREDDSKGRHTTTHRELIMLPCGAMVIDTPGMRELGMWDVSSGIDQSFSDVMQYVNQCKFGDCQHESEPGCAVKAALRSGDLSPERWKSYQNLMREAKFTQSKEAYLKIKQEKFKGISKHIRNNPDIRK
ncbi:MAG: ribosome small subunit-dependent GTPase A [Clostridiales bacterium]|nr:ribosome small subunit-dependent GTPase A [Clostridiales bacterium]